MQFVCVVKYRSNLIHTSWKVELYKYITGIVEAKGHKLLAINGMPDHLHILISMKPHQSTSELCQVIKANSSRWINERKFTRSKFEWQSGFGAFSYSKSHVSSVATYIHNQEIHHAKKTFHKEYQEFLIEHEIDFDENYTFHEPLDE